MQPQDGDSQCFPSGLTSKSPLSVSSGTKVTVHIRPQAVISFSLLGDKSVEREAYREKG
jgi:hypothetical protein